MTNINHGQSIIEYVLLVAITIIAVVVASNLGGDAFNKHFKTAAKGYFLNGGTTPDTK
ncbi:MAG: hypothetical protein M0Q96_00685 [Candidatus Omnitrophica bacterium]|jgi:hypothetical protein|nr:hypothetical protein [Candidatus Omnitrophota bacterium]